MLYRVARTPLSGAFVIHSFEARSGHFRKCETTVLAVCGNETATYIPRITPKTRPIRILIMARYFFFGPGRLAPLRMPAFFAAEMRPSFWPG